jgi:hypothetical protein
MPGSHRALGKKETRIPHWLDISPKASNINKVKIKKKAASDWSKCAVNNHVPDGGWLL